MNIIAKPRSTGKTTEAVKLAIENNHRIIAIHQKERERLMKAYPELKDGQVVLWSEIISYKTRLDRRFDGYFVDNIDLLFHSLTGESLEGITYTDEDNSI